LAVVRVTVYPPTTLLMADLLLQLRARGTAQVIAQAK
jgi:hypothetical protein